MDKMILLKPAEKSNKGNRDNVLSFQEARAKQKRSPVDPLEAAFEEGVKTGLMIALLELLNAVFLQGRDPGRVAAYAQQARFPSGYLQSISEAVVRGLIGNNNGR
ncbi:MAG: hypothetical protein AB1767_06995 [Bacillota bacterium]